MELQFTQVETERIDYRSETRDIRDFVLEHVSRIIGENNTIFLSSKIVSLFQKNVQKFSNNTEKEDFAKGL